MADMKPICVPCQRFYRPERNGCYFVEGMPVGHTRAPPGTEAPHLWQPYKLWMGDLWRCQGCGARIIVGSGHQPISEHYKENFADDVVSSGAQLQVNDC